LFSCCRLSTSLLTSTHDLESGHLSYCTLSLFLFPLFPLCDCLSVSVWSLRLSTFSCSHSCMTVCLLIWLPGTCSVASNCPDVQFFFLDVSSFFSFCQTRDMRVETKRNTRDRRQAKRDQSISPLLFSLLRRSVVSPSLSLSLSRSPVLFFFWTSLSFSLLSFGFLRPFLLTIPPPYSPARAFRKKNRQTSRRKEGPGGRRKGSHCPAFRFLFLFLFFHLVTNRKRQCTKENACTSRASFLPTFSFRNLIWGINHTDIERNKERKDACTHCTQRLREALMKAFKNRTCSWIESRAGSTQGSLRVPCPIP